MYRQLAEKYPELDEFIALPEARPDHPCWTTISGKPWRMRMTPSIGARRRLMAPGFAEEAGPDDPGPAKSRHRLSQEI